MVRWVETIIVEVCSRCHENSGSMVPTDASEDVTIGGVAYRLDLCAECKKEMFDPFATEIQRIGIKAGPPSPGKPPASMAKASQHLVPGHPEITNALECPVCKRVTTMFNNLRKHIEDSHSKFYTSDKGLPWVLSRKGSGHSVPCPYCGATPKGVTGLGYHLSAQHDNIYQPGQAALIVGFHLADAMRANKTVEPSPIPGMDKANSSG